MIRLAQFDDPQRVFAYEYRCENASWLTPLFRRLISEPIARALPRRVAPNLITFAANIALAASCAFLIIFARQADDDNRLSRIWLLLPAAGVLAYAALDNADGLHAKRIGATGPLGDFLDHWLDGLAAFLIPIALTELAGVDELWQCAVVTAAMLAFWATGWERLHSGCMRLPLMGDVEANLFASSLLVASAMLGPEVWSSTVGGISAGVWLCVLVIAGSAIAVFQGLWKGVRREQILGVGLSFALLWTWELLRVGQANGTHQHSMMPAALMGIVGAKHVGDLLRSHLIGVRYRPVDPGNVVFGIALCLSEIVPTALTPYWMNKTLPTLVLVAAAARLAFQFWTTVSFIGQTLGVKLLSVSSSSELSEQGAEPKSAPGSRPMNSHKETCNTGYRLFHLSVPILIVIGLQVILAIWAQLAFEHQQYQPMTVILWSLGVSIVTTTVLFQIIALLLLDHSKIRALVSIALTTCFLGLLAAHLLLEHPLDFYFVGDNLNELFYPESLGMAVGRLSFETMLVFFNVVLIFALLIATTRVFSKWPAPRRRRRNLLLHASIFALILLTSLYRHNELTFFVRTAVDYFSGRHAYPGLPVVEKYPYLHLVADSPNSPTDSPRPTIFLILMESFNANFVETTTDDGREYTPIFNARMKEGIYVERFYGNSIQTVRAHLPTLCSIPPSYWGKVATHYPNLRLRTLPAILRDAGYYTLFFQSQQSLVFDQVGEFMKRLGFQEVHSMDGAFIGPADKPFVWGWGLQDDKTFEKLFGHLDQLKMDREPQTDGPFFVMILTTSHHYPFKEMPHEQRYLYPEPENRKQEFANSIHLGDRFLGAFFAELEKRPDFNNSLVVICGDHSFPAGEHGNYFNEYRFYEENFRTPLLLWWPGQLSPRRISDVDHSQLDIAPTILDLLNVNTSNHFQGTSIVNENARERKAVPLIQPYDGTFLCVVKYPFKYVEGIRVPDRYLFNLADDPHEQKNLLDKYEGTEILRELEQEVVKIHLNQLLIDRNRIWPAAEELRSMIQAPATKALPETSQ